MPAQVTVKEAREQVLEHLDDPRGVRFAKTTAGVQDFSRVDRALRSALDRCVDDYVAAGGDRLDEEVAVTTSATDGAASMAAYRPVSIRHVLSEPSANNLYPVDEADLQVGGLPDLTARALRVRFVRRYEVPPTPAPDDLLVGGTSDVSRSWPGFDNWVIAVAAWQLGVKDKEGLDRMGSLASDLARAAIGQPRTPRSYPWPMPDNRPRLLRRLRWSFEPHSFSIRMVFDPLWRW